MGRHELTPWVFPPGRSFFLIKLVQFLLLLDQPTRHILKFLAFPPAIHWDQARQQLDSFCIHGFRLAAQPNLLELASVQRAQVAELKNSTLLRVDEEALLDDLRQSKRSPEIRRSLIEFSISLKPSFSSEMNIPLAEIADK